jgi:formiminotetrahydrofolate cyclodeaminase
MLVDNSVREMLGALASPAPTPGGGSAAALAAALGSALLVMVASHRKTRTGSDAERSTLGAASGALEAIRTQLTEAVDADAAAYQAVVNAYRLPKSTETEQSARRAAIQQAFRHATDVPLHVMAWSAAALGHAAAIADAVYRPAATDGRAGVALLRAALDAARLNVAANVGSVADDDYVAAVRAESDRLADAAEDAASRADDLLGRI